MYGKDGGKMERWMKVKEDGRRRYRIARVGHRVLFRSERSVLFRSKKRTLHSFQFFSLVFGDL